MEVARDPAGSAFRAISKRLRTPGQAFSGELEDLATGNQGSRPSDLPKPLPSEIHDPATLWAMPTRPNVRPSQATKACAVRRLDLAGSEASGAYRLHASLRPTKVV